MSAVINEIRTRGFVVERLTREYLRVYSALRALGGDGEIDALTTRLARAFADLSAIDVLPGELSAGATHNVATVSAPIFDGDGAVSMSVTAAPFTSSTPRRSHVSVNRYAQPLPTSPDGAMATTTSKAEEHHDRDHRAGPQSTDRAWSPSMKSNCPTAGPATPSSTFTPAESAAAI